MAAEPPAHSRSVQAARWFAVAYALASLVAALIGRPPLLTIRGDGAISYVIGYCLLGPLSTLVHALYDHGDTFVGLVFYTVQTALLAACLLLWPLRSRMVQWIGYITTAAIWAGSGYMMAVTWALST
jgi:hypothetical protein